MYGRAINFTLLAPSLWSVVEAVAQPIDTKDLNNGFYLLKIQNAETQITQKISVLRH